MSVRWILWGIHFLITVSSSVTDYQERRRDLAKVYQWPILISEGTYQQVKDEFDAELVDSVIVKGKTELVKIYKLLGERIRRQLTAFNHEMSKPLLRSSQKAPSEISLVI